MAQELHLLEAATTEFRGSAAEADRRLRLEALDAALAAFDAGTVDVEALGAMAPHPRRCGCGWRRVREVLEPLDALEWVWLDDQGDLSATCPPSCRMVGLERFFSRVWHRIKVEYCGTDLVVEGVGARPKDSRRFWAVLVSPEVYAVVTGLRPAAVLLTRTKDVRSQQRRALGLSDGEARLVGTLAAQEPVPTYREALWRHVEALEEHRAAHPGDYPLGGEVLEIVEGLARGWEQGFEDLVVIAQGLAVEGRAERAAA